MMQCRCVWIKLGLVMLRIPQFLSIDLQYDQICRNLVHLFDRRMLEELI